LAGGQQKKGLLAAFSAPNFAHVQAVRSMLQPQTQTDANARATMM
jgi:hypothetical protein